MASTVLGLIDCAISNLEDVRNMQAQISIGLLKQFKQMHKDGIDDNYDLDDYFNDHPEDSEKYKLQVDYTKCF